MPPGLGRQYYVPIAHIAAVNNEMLAGEMSKTQRSSTFGGLSHSLLGVLAANLKKALAPPRALGVRLNIENERVTIRDSMALKK